MLGGWRMIRFVLVVNLAHAFLPTHQHRMSLRNHRGKRQPCTDGGFNQRRATSSQLFSKSPWRKRLSNILPPISEQENQLTKISDHFRPRFVLREFLIGVQYMLQVHSWVTIGSFLGRNLIHDIFLPLSTNYKWLLQGSSFRPPIYDLAIYLDSSIKRVLYKRSGFGWNPDWMHHIVVGPLLEEIIYRGIGPMLYQFSIVFGFWCFSWFCRWTMLGAPFLFLGYRVFDLYLTLQKTSWNAMILLSSLGALVADALFFVPVQIGIWATARKYHRHTNGTDEAIADSGTHVLTKDKASAEHSGGEPFVRTLVNRIAKVVTRGADDDDDTPSSLIPKLERSILMASFWMTSMSFGAAHIPQIPSKDPLLQWVYVTKFFGTFASSFCIERRLCLRRRTLWSAVGSHMAYNALSPFVFGANELVFSKIFTDLPLLVRVLEMILVVLIIQCRQWLLFDPVANWLGRVEQRLAKTVE